MTKDANNKHTDTAVALSYDGKDAPTITATGINEVAEEIVRIAKEHDVHLHQDAVLARVLSTLDIGTEIPRSLYQAIAEVIAFAYYLKGKVPDNWQAKEPPEYQMPEQLGHDTQN
jgi:flagellar biosynthesis protein